jgi:hypothetical protein
MPVDSQNYDNYLVPGVHTAEPKFFYRSVIHGIKLDSQSARRQTVDAGHYRSNCPLCSLHGPRHPRTGLKKNLRCIFSKIAFCLISRFSPFVAGWEVWAGGPVHLAFFCDLIFCDQIKTIGLSPHPLQAIKIVHAPILDVDLSFLEMSDNFYPYHNLLKM